VKITVASIIGVSLAVSGTLFAPKEMSVEAQAATTCLFGMCSKPSPAGCDGHTDYVHNSTASNYRWTISVHGRTTCRAATTSLKTYTALYIGQWWGWQWKADDTKTSSWSKKTSDAAPHWYCKGVTGSWRYLGQTQHTSVENGQTYSATTSHVASLTCMY